jgi:chemotaxis protein MotB
MADKGGGAPAWMATFADLMSLLLTLFVLMLTFAEMDVIKYKAIAGSMSNALGTSRKDKLAGIVEIDGSLRKKVAKDVDLSKKEEESKQEANVQSISVELPVLSEEELEKAMQKVEEKRADELKKILSDAIEGEMQKSGVSVERNGSNVVIRFPSSIAFPSGSNALNTDFTDLIEKLAPTLKKTPGEIIVSGHTDNVPLRGGAFESNWDLSAARATSVIHNLLFDHEMDPSRMTVQGFGDSRPLTSNDTAEGRSSNRRVEITIVSPDAMKELNKTAKDAGATISKGFYDD